MLCLCLEVGRLRLLLLLAGMHLISHDLAVQSGQVVTLLKALDVVGSVLVMMRVLVAVRMVNVDVRVVVVDHHDPAAVGDVVDILGALWLLLLLGLMRVLLSLHVVEIMLI